MPMDSDHSQPATLLLEDHARLAIQHLRGNLDRQRGYLPYFHTFLQPDPAEARHDFPDWGDIGGRYWNGLMLMRCMTGSSEGDEEEAALRELVLGGFSERDGLNYRPDSPWSKHDALMFDQGRVLLALTTWYMQGSNREATRWMDQMLDGLSRVAVKHATYWDFPYKAHPPTGWDAGYDGGLGAIGAADPAYDAGQWLPAIVRYAELTGSETGLELARQIIAWNLHGFRAFGADGSFGGHFHSRAATIAGIVRFARFTSDVALIEWARRAFEFARSQGAEFGWFPEIVEHTSPFSQGCETCCIADMVEAGILLARSGYLEYWDLVERIVRNHLIESQLRSVDWVPYERRGDDTPRSSFDRVAERVLGGFAGRSFANDYVGADGSFDDGNKYWMMNCCSGAGPHALYLAWHNCVTFETRDVFHHQRCVYVNLALTRDTRWARVVSHRPYRGRVEIKMHMTAPLAVRVPDWVDHRQVTVSRDGVLTPFVWERSYAVLDQVKAGELVTVEYPIRRTNESVCVGGRDYEITWKGDTVIGISPEGTDYPLYRRSSLDAPEAPLREVELHVPVNEIAW